MSPHRNRFAAAINKCGDLAAGLAKAVLSLAESRGRTGACICMAIMISLAISSPASAYMPLDQSQSSDENPFKYSISIAPSFAWPHFNKLNDSLSFAGNEFTNLAYHFAEEDSHQNYTKAAGFKNISMDYGGQVAFSHEFDEDMRAGVVFGATFVSMDEKLTLKPQPSATNGNASGYWSSTDYSVSQSLSLPLFQVGVFVHRIFRFEEEPRLRLYMGGWGNFGSLIGASLSGKAYNADIYPVTEHRYNADLAGNSWGAGAVGGIEYNMTQLLTAYLETGWEYFIIHNVDRTGHIKSVFLQRDANGNEFSTTVSDKYTNIPEWKDGNDKSIPLDYGGVFIRFGIRMGLSWL